MTESSEVPVAKEYRVLIVEDEDAVARYFVATLGKVFDTEAVTTAADAIMRLTYPVSELHPRVDAILLDLTLPNGKGIDLIVRFHRAAAAIPIVVITGGDYDRREVIRAGAQQLLRKPEASQQQIIDAHFDAIARVQVQAESRSLDKSLKEVRASTEESLGRLDTALGRPPSPLSGQMKKDKEP